MPPVELDEEPPEDELELELEELLLDEDELEPLVLPDEPKLDEPPVAPELVEVDEVDVEVPFELELELPLLDEPELPWLELPWLEEPWLDDPWLDEPWLELPWLEEPDEPF